MENLEVKIVLEPGVKLPEYATKGSSCMDVYYTKVDKVYNEYNQEIDIPYINEDGNLVLYPGERAMLNTGMKIGLPEGYELQVRSRSGNALKLGLMISNGIGTSDADYTGTLKVLVSNTTKNNIILEKGKAVAQIAVMPVPKITWKEVTHLYKTERGENGFGSTDTKGKEGKEEVLKVTTEVKTEPISEIDEEPVVKKATKKSTKNVDTEQTKSDNDETKTTL